MNRHSVCTILAIIFLDHLLVAPNFVEACDCSPDAVIVQTNYGKVRGSILTSRNNRPFYAYRGIPFAKPPIGNLRFRAPVSPEPWEDVLDATENAPMCIQKNFLFSEHPTVEGQEDCLYINVYSPRLPVLKETLCNQNQINKALTTAKERLQIEKQSQLLPVMVFIHFGAFLAGTGHSDHLGPHYFMDKDIVVVTFNYRVGVFGFLSTDDDASPGNWGLKDQVAALKWVQNNIDKFGGNKDQVTIFGESAGAVSVHYHLVNPATKNLFHQAISQSGTTLALWARPTNQLQVTMAKNQAKFVGCDSDAESETMVECLRGIDATTLADSADQFKIFSSEPLIVYGPVTEQQTLLNPEPYITKDPLDLIQDGEFQKLPWISGVLADEGIMKAAQLFRNPETLKSLNENFDDYVPNILLDVPGSVTPEEVDSTWTKIIQQFLTGNYIDIADPKSVQGFIDLYSDRSFNYGSYQSALLQAWSGHDTIWFYNFDYRGEYTYGDHFAGTTEDIDFEWGVCHTDDLLYLFSSPELFSPLKNSNDLQMSKALIQMWTDFAINGDPSPNNEIAKLKWNAIPNLQGKPSVKNSDLSYLNIVGRHNPKEGEAAITFEIRNDFLSDRMKFWESLPLAENIDGIE